MKYFHDVLTLTATAATTFDEGDLVGYDDAKITVADRPVKGVAKHPATEVGMAIGVIAIGVASVKAVGVINKGDKIITADGGGVKVAVVGSVNVFAMALTSAADGQLVSILLR